MERRLAAIMATDVVGYSRLIRADEEGTLAALKVLRADLINPKIAEHHGRIVKLMGDGMLVEFASVVDAVRTAVETQAAVAKHYAGLPEDKRIEFRVGINLGDVIIDGDDIHGDGVNVAARLESLAEPGGVCVSDKVYEEVRDRTDFAFEDLGEREVKNIDRPVRVWQWIVDAGLAADVPAKTDEPLSLPDKPSIAVLPFDNMSGDPEQEYFGDGIAEDVITALSRFNSLFVIARNSSFTYKGQAIDIAQVGRELGVRYVVEGSVRKAGNRVRITAQLIDAASGNHLWADRFDRDITDIFELQDEITETVVGAVEQEIGSTERTRATHMHPENLQAWELLQRGLFHVWQMNREGLAVGVDLLRQSVEKDPSFADAHAYLAFTYLHQVFLGTIDDTENTILEATKHTHEAIKHDDHSSMGHEVSARLLCFEKRFDEAVAAAKRAIQYNPNSSSANFALSVVCFFADRHDDALAPINRAIRLSPKDHRRFNHLQTKGGILGELGKLEEAIELLREGVSLQHGDYRGSLLLARYCAEAGLMEEARRAASRVLELNPNFTLRSFAATLHPDFVTRFLKFVKPFDFPK